MTDGRSEGQGQSGQAFNFATGDAKVGAQAGIINGNIYNNFGHDETARSKYIAAIDFLKSGAGATAAQLIREAVVERFTGDHVISRTQIAYYWSLALLSGRSFEQLNPESDIKYFERARNLADKTGRDRFLSPHRVICKLFDGLQRQAQDRGPDPAFGQLLDDYLLLEKEFQEDFQRHLDLMLAGGIDDNLEALLAENANEQRMSDGRAERAWKFFEATPTEPKKRVITRPVLPGGSWAVAIFGGLLCLLALALAIRVLRDSGIARLVLLTLAVIAGAAVAVPSWTSYQADSERLAERDREFGEYRNTRYSTPAPAGGESAPLDDSEDDDEAEKARTSRLRRKRFAQMAIRHLNDQFNKHAPTTRAGRRRWDADTRHLKESLRKELLAQYNEPDLDAGSINWLINFRVQEIARKWRAGSLREYWKRLQPRARDSFGAVAGVIFSAIALAYMLVLAAFREPFQVALIVFLVITGCGLIMLSRIDIHLVGLHRLQADTNDARQRDEAELEEYRRWVDVLRDQPADHEMARWLDFDKLQLKKLVMSQLGLMSQDILSHATLTQPAAAPFWPAHDMVRRGRPYMASRSSCSPALGCGRSRRGLISAPVTSTTSSGAASGTT